LEDVTENSSLDITVYQEWAGGLWRKGRVGKQEYVLFKKELDKDFS
jgi:hypothetical protein